MQANAVKVQKRLCKSRSPVQQAGDVIEHVLSTDGDDYLETSQHRYAWWQLALLDVHACILLGVLIAVSVIGLILWLLLRGLRSTLRLGRVKVKNV